jgi:hypothetical protein
LALALSFLLLAVFNSALLTRNEKLKMRNREMRKEIQKTREY